MNLQNQDIFLCIKDYFVHFLFLLLSDIVFSYGGKCMKKETLKIELNVINNKIGVIKVGEVDYISLTDLARYKDKERTDYIIQNWMRTTNSILFLGTWEYLHNENFNTIEFDGFKMESGSNSFVMTPQKWIKQTYAIGMISKSGRYGGGTFAHPDIAFEFASWLSPEFKLYLIKEFERLKQKELEQENIEWKATRLLSKANYAIHTDAIKENIVPILTEEQKKYIYQEEAEVLNVALFGMTSKQWREHNPILSKEGNIRDYADLLHLVILNNLEAINSELIKGKIPQKERLIKLNQIARKQMMILSNNQSINKLEQLQENSNKQELISVDDHTSYN